MGHALDFPLRGRGQAIEGGGLRLTAQPRRPVGNGDHTMPALRKFIAGQQRSELLRAGPPAPLHDEASKRECPGADRRAPPAPHGARQRGRVHRQSVHFGQPARHGQAELGSRAKPAVRGDASMDPDAGPAADPVVRQEPLGEGERPLRLVALGGQPVGGGNLEQERGLRHRRAHPAEAPPQRTAKIQHPEVQPGRGLDEDATASGHTR